MKIAAGTIIRLAIIGMYAFSMPAIADDEPTTQATSHPHIFDKVVITGSLGKAQTGSWENFVVYIKSAPSEPFTFTSDRASIAPNGDFSLTAYHVPLGDYYVNYGIPSSGMGAWRVAVNAETINMGSLEDMGAAEDSGAADNAGE